MLPMLLLPLLSLNGWAAAPQGWSPELLHSAAAWSDRMNDAVVSADENGLRIEIAPGRRWAIAAVPGMVLPADIGRVRVRVGAVGGGGRWLMRLYGDGRGRGEPGTISLMEGSAATGTIILEPDPRLLRLRHRPPLQVQLGLEGEPGAHAVFEAVEFLPGAARPRTRTVAGQRNIEAVDLMPNLPEPLKIIDWQAKARAYDRFVFDFEARGEFLPLIWLDDSRINIDRPTFGLPSYVGDERLRGGNQESITCMGAVLSATLAGIDKRSQEHDYVLMSEAFYNRRNGNQLVLNNQNQSTGGSFWYEIWPQIVFGALADRYPGAGEMDAIVRAGADRWCDAVQALTGPEGVPDFDHTAFDFQTMQPVDNGRWREPDAAAGVAWLQYTAWVRFGDGKYLDAAEACLRFLEGRDANPYYEVLLPWGACVAARMNAELGRDYDVDRLLHWCFDISDCRGGWGVIVQKWGGYDCHGLVGSVDNRGGYAFAMNTFAQAGALVPLARYDARYARAIGKWMLNLANAARLFYPNELPEANQCCAWWKGDPQGVIAYEGLRREWDGRSPFATGDPVLLGWGPKTDLGLYGSGYVGMLGGIVGRTNHEAILQLDCLATGFFHERAYPTFLYYNPYRVRKDIEVDVGPQPCDLYDAATHRFLKRDVRDRARFTLPGDTAAVVVVVPANGAATREGNRLLIDGVVVDHRRW